MTNARTVVVLATVMSGVPIMAHTQTTSSASRSAAVPVQESDTLTATARTRQLIHEIVAASYPTLGSVDVQLGTFRSDSDYFRTSFGASRFMFGAPMRYRIDVNPEWLSRMAPDEAVRSILAHELAHVLELNRGNRIRLLGLADLVFPGKDARFERRTDLEAIARHYGQGLKSYRRWLYANVPPSAARQKRRDYFSPEEIDAILARIEGRPDRLAYWFKHVPMSLAEITSLP